MADHACAASPNDGRSFVSGLLAYALDTVIVYVSALRVSGMLVGRLFAWIAPLLQISITGSPGDWYLRHFEVVTIIPALAAGYINVGRFVPAFFGKPINDRRPAYAAVWAWTVPALVLVWRMLRYQDPSESVILGPSTSAFQYFFEIQQTMPTWKDFLAGDPERVLAQMTVTAPFYAGLAYSLGAVASKYRALQKFFATLRPERGLLPDQDEPSTPAPPSSAED